VCRWQGPAVRSNSSCEPGGLVWAHVC
jgi:hypothetical protein